MFSLFFNKEKIIHKAKAEVYAQVYENKQQRQKWNNMNKNQLDNFFAQFDFGGDSVSSPGEWQEDEKDHFSCVHLIRKKCRWKNFFPCKKQS